jgi:hypothetical protein
MSIDERGEQWIAEAAYEHYRKFSSREQMAQFIELLLSENTTTASPLLRNIIIRMAMIFSAEEGHS